MNKNESFFEFFNEKVNFLESNCKNRIEEIILSCSYLDALSCYYSGEKSSFRNFKAFILKFSDLENIWSRISLTLLQQHLTDKNDNYYTSFISFLENELGVKTFNFNNLNYNPDIDFDKLEKESKKYLDEKYFNTLKQDILKFEYVLILWREYRNKAVHGASAYPDRALLNLVNKEEPYYLNEGSLNMNINQSITRFDIPPIFILNTLKNCISNFKQYVDNNEIEISPPSNKIRKKKNTCISIGYPRLITKPFRTINRDTTYFISQAKLFHNRLKKEDDPSLRNFETAYSRASILFDVLFLESLVLNILDSEFKILNIDQLPLKYIKKFNLVNQELDRIELKDRLYLLPYLCNDSSFDIQYFDRGSKKFQQLIELIDIRNSFVHSQKTSRKMSITTKNQRDFEIDDDYPENFWPLTKIPKDIFIIEFKDAVKSKEIIREVLIDLDNFLGNKILTKEWLEEEKFEFGPHKENNE